MKLTAAVTLEQGQTFVVVLVKDRVLTESSPGTRDEMLVFVASEFQMPVALLGETGDVAYGDANIVDWLESVDPEDLPWREYEFSEATQGPCPKTWLGKRCQLQVGHFEPCQFNL